MGFSFSCLPTRPRCPTSVLKFFENDRLVAAVVGGAPGRVYGGEGPLLPAGEEREPVPGQEVSLKNDRTINKRQLEPRAIDPGMILRI